MIANHGKHVVIWYFECFTLFFKHDAVILDIDNFRIEVHLYLVMFNKGVKLWQYPWFYTFGIGTPSVDDCNITAGLLEFNGCVHTGILSADHEYILVEEGMGLLEVVEYFILLLPRDVQLVRLPVIACGNHEMIAAIAAFGCLQYELVSSLPAG